FFLIVFWLAVAYWVFKDARRRIEDPWLVAMATVLGLALPFIGAFVYMLFRPPEYLEEVRERELEMRAMAERLAQNGPHSPVCPPSPPGCPSPRGGSLPCPPLSAPGTTGGGAPPESSRWSRSGRFALTARRPWPRPRRSSLRPRPPLPDGAGAHPNRAHPNPAHP